jgi:hypothetical protein
MSPGFSDKYYNTMCKLIDEESGLRLPDDDNEKLHLASWLFTVKDNPRGSQQREISELLRCFERTRKAVKSDWIWNAHFSDLLAYRGDYHTFVLSKKDTARKKLSSWAIRQRRVMGKGETLLPDRRARMVEAGFDFNPCNTPCRKRKYTPKQEDARKEKYHMLVDVKNRHGHCNVPFHYGANPILAKWVSYQRIGCKKGTMDEARKELLDALGFNWSLRKSASGGHGANDASDADYEALSKP